MTSGTSCKSGLFHVPSTELQYQAEVQLPEVPGGRVMGQYAYVLLLSLHTYVVRKPQ